MKAMEKSQDLKTFNSLFKQYRGRFTRFAYTYLRDNESAEDFTLKAFLHYWENRETLDEETNIPGYILTIIKRKCLNHLHHLEIRKDVTQQLTDHAIWELNTRIATLEACEPYDLFRREAQEIIEKTLSGLPEQTRKIFLMSRYENKPHKEISAELNISTKSVEFHISKALRKLRLALKDYLPVFLYLFM